MLGPQELIVILLIAILIFGGKKIPEIMEGVGKGIKSFKKAMEGEETTPPPATMQTSPPAHLEAPVKESEKNQAKAT